MCIVSNSEFYSNPKKYTEIARNERVLIQGEHETFELNKVSDEKKYITAEEVKAGVEKHIRSRFAERK